MDILKIISNFEGTVQPHLYKLYNYYNSDNRIMHVKKDSGKPNNKIASGYAKSIVTNSNGYFLGNPIVTTAEDEDLQSAIDEINNYNDEDYHNIALGTDIFTFGYAIEYMYLDEDKRIRYTKLNPLQTYVNYDDRICTDCNDRINYAIRWYDTEDIESRTITRHIEYIDAKSVVYYRIVNGSLVMIDEINHRFGLCPIAIYCNNEEKQSAFECVLTQIDAYDKVTSESVNDWEQFTDSFLYLGDIDLDENDIPNLRDNRLISGTETPMWVTKNVNDTYVQNIKDQLKNDIFTFSQTVDLSDENFANNASGVAMQYKLMNFEFRIGATERLFVRGLSRRYEVICGILNYTGAHYDFSMLKFQFTRNLPADIASVVNEFAQLGGKVSNRTLLTLLPFIDDVDDEIGRINEERDQYAMNNFGWDDEVSAGEVEGDG